MLNCKRVKLLTALAPPPLKKTILAEDQRATMLPPEMNGFKLMYKTCLFTFIVAGHAPTCRQIVSAASMRDIEWNTWTCVLGFPVIGNKVYLQFST